jgi:exodeoxyribonuclease VII small subunit
MPTAKKAGFEDLYRQLEEKVARLEKGGLSLDDSLAAYEEAVALAQRCQQLLDQAELRITRLRESFQSGGVAAGEEEFEEEETD